MKELAFRLERGSDLKHELSLASGEETAVVLSSVGSLSKVNMRLAGANDTLEIERDFEILSLNGTLSHGDVHCHISVGDEKGNVLGGHLLEGSIVNTTCEVVLGILEEYDSLREYDENTGFREIKFWEKKNAVSD